MRTGFEPRNVTRGKFLGSYDTESLFGSEGFLFNDADDVYTGGVPTRVAIRQTFAPGLYVMVGLELGWGPKKT